MIQIKLGCLLHISSFLYKFSLYFCDQQNSSYAIKHVPQVSAIILDLNKYCLIQLFWNQIVWFDVCSSYLWCLWLICCDACLSSLVIVCIACLTFRRERCRNLRGGGILWSSSTRTRELCRARQATPWACT